MTPLGERLVELIETTGSPELDEIRWRAVNELLAEGAPLRDAVIGSTRRGDPASIVTGVAFGLIAGREGL